MSDFSLSHLSVLLLLNKMIASRDSVAALGFSLSSLSTFPKSRSLIVETDLDCSENVFDGLVSLPPGKWYSTRCEIKVENALQSIYSVISSSQPASVMNKFHHLEENLSLSSQKYRCI